MHLLLMAFNKFKDLGLLDLFNYYKIFTTPCILLFCIRSRPCESDQMSRYKKGVGIYKFNIQ